MNKISRFYSYIAFVKYLIFRYLPTFVPGFFLSAVRIILTGKYALRLLTEGNTKKVHHELMDHYSIKTGVLSGRCCNCR